MIEVDNVTGIQDHSPNNKQANEKPSSTFNIHFIETHQAATTESNSINRQESKTRMSTQFDPNTAQNLGEVRVFPLSLLLVFGFAKALFIYMI